MRVIINWFLITLSMPIQITQKPIEKLEYLYNVRQTDRTEQHLRSCDLLSTPTFRVAYTTL